MKIIERKPAERTITLWDIFFVGAEKALVCIPPQDNSRHVRTATVSLRGEDLVIKRDDGKRFILTIGEGLAEQFRHCKEMLIAESTGAAGFSASYEAQWS